MSETVITAENFTSVVLKSHIPVLLDFWATWCGPCKMISPVVAEIASEYAGKILVGTVNVDEQPELAAAFDVQSIPTLALVKNGGIADLSVGYVPKEKIIDMLNRHI